MFQACTPQCQGCGRCARGGRRHHRRHLLRRRCARVLRDLRAGLRGHVPHHDRQVGRCARPSDAGYRQAAALARLGFGVESGRCRSFCLRVCLWRARFRSQRRFLRRRRCLVRLTSTGTTSCQLDKLSNCQVVVVYLSTWQLLTNPSVCV